MSLRDKKKTQTRTAILSATRLLIETKEFESITTRLIAETAEISYQTLYNYFPTKTDILTELVKEHFDNSGETYQQIVRTFSGDLIDALLQLNQSFFRWVPSKNESSDYFDIWAKIFFGTKSSERLSLVQSFDQLFGEQYHSILALARGMGLFKEHTDIQLMAHTLEIVSSYAVQTFLISEPQSKNSAFLESLNLQTIQLVKPYLLEKTG